MTALKRPVPPPEVCTSQQDLRDWLRMKEIEALREQRSGHVIRDFLEEVRRRRVPGVELVYE